MHTLESNSSNVPAFLVKLWKLVEDTNCNDSIAWSDSNNSFIIKDQAMFAKELLPIYFKHNNMGSFIRQLNIYGFKKVINYEKTGLRNENNEVEFQHIFFVKERSELLKLIKRKTSNPKVPDSPSKTNAKDILADLTSIRKKQEIMDRMLLKLKQENQLLRRELTAMRQKHKAQEQIIQKILQFMLSAVRRGNPNMGVGVPRKVTRIIPDSPETSSSQLSRTMDGLQNNNSDCIIVPEQIVGPLRTVIHEVTDNDDDTNYSPISIVKPPIVIHAAESPASINENDVISKSSYTASTANNLKVPMEQPGILQTFQQRNALTNRLLSVDESLSFAQDRLASDPWSLDISNFLGLFSSDAIPSYNPVSSGVRDDTCVKTKANDIMGNEIVAFNSNILEVENAPLFETLNQEAEVPSIVYYYSPEPSLDVLNQTTTADASNFSTDEASRANNSEEPLFEALNQEAEVPSIVYYYSPEPPLDVLNQTTTADASNFSTESFERQYF